MSYYLSLVGLGLFFVLVVHLYNRWTFFMFRRQEERRQHEHNAEVTPPSPPAKRASSSISGASGAHASQMIKPQHAVGQLTSHFSTTRASAGAPSGSSAGSASGAVSAQGAGQGGGGAREGTANATMEMKAIERKIFVTLSEEIPAEHLREWLLAVLSATPLIMSVFALSHEKKWMSLWQRPINGIDMGHAGTTMTSLAQGAFKQIQINLALANRRAYFTHESHRALVQALENWSHLSANANGAQGEGAPVKHSHSLADEDAEVWVRDAKALDQLCAEFDVQIALTLKCREAAGVSGGQISKAAATEGLVFEQGAFRKFSGRGDELFHLEFNLGGSPPESLSALENLIGTQMTFYLDIPHVAEGRAVFQEMARLAQHLSAAARADLIDDRGHPLSSVSLDTIGEQIAQIQMRMAQAGLPAGSSLAHRLFSS